MCIRRNGTVLPYLRQPYRRRNDPMLRRLSRLLIIALLLAVIALAASRLMGGDDDDFDEFDDLDSGFEFQETPVEIDVPAQEAATPAPEQYTASQDDTTAD